MNGLITILVDLAIIAGALVLACIIWIALDKTANLKGDDKNDTDDLS